MKKTAISLFTALMAMGIIFTACKKAEKSTMEPAIEQPEMKEGEEMPGEAMMPTEVEYMITLKSDWTPENFPIEYPEAGVLTGPHFSGMVGASHNADYTLFKEGVMPTPGLERLSEEGKHSPLDDEIKKAIAEGKSMMLFESDALRDFAKTATTKVKVNDKYPMVSVVNMIAPSPDWFTGVADLNLKENGEWVTTKEIQIFAWDSGGDDGATYKAPDMDTNPKKPTTMSTDPHFMKDGSKMAVGMLTFTKM
jgi:hypothetical protein